MKGTAFIVLLLSVVCMAQSATSPDFIKKITKFLEPCAKENGIEENDVIKLLVSRQLPETKEMKCTLDCYMENAGYVKDGEFDVEKGKEANKEKYDDPELVAKADAVCETCAKTVDIKGKEKCEISPAILKCLYDESAKLNLPTPSFLKPKDE